MSYAPAAEVMDLNPLSRSQQSFLNLAMKAAKASSCVHSHGAIIVRGGSVLSIGINKWRNDFPLVSTDNEDEKSFDISVHAEIDALSRVSNPRGATIYIARVNKKGQARMSKPCKRCAQALKDAGVSKVIYTTNE